MRGQRKEFLRKRERKKLEQLLASKVHWVTTITRARLVGGVITWQFDSELETPSVPLRSDGCLYP